MKLILYLFSSKALATMTITTTIRLQQQWVKITTTISKTTVLKIKIGSSQNSGNLASKNLWNALYNSYYYNTNYNKNNNNNDNDNDKNKTFERLNE